MAEVEVIKDCFPFAYTGKNTCTQLIDDLGNLFFTSGGLSYCVLV